MMEVGEGDDSLAAEFSEGKIGLWKELNPCNWEWGDPLAQERKGLGQQSSLLFSFFLSLLWTVCMTEKKRREGVGATQYLGERSHLYSQPWRREDLC